MSAPWVQILPSAPLAVGSNLSSRTVRKAAHTLGLAFAAKGSLARRGHDA